MAESPSELQNEIDKLERKHAENPDGRYFVPLANDYRKVGDLDRAESLLRTGIEKHPEYLSARIVLGRCLAERGENAAAAAEFEYVLSMDPQNLIALRSLAELSVADGRVDDAERWYRELLAVDPMNEDARQALEAMPTAAEGEAGVGSEVGSWWEPESEEAPPAALPGAQEPAFDARGPEARGAGGAPRAPDGYDATGLDDGVDDWDLPEEIESVEVVTETIAELYARQGLHDRAAEVYRELIRRRGGDPDLQRRLDDLTAAAAGPDAGTAPDAIGLEDAVPAHPTRHLPDELVIDSGWPETIEGEPGVKADRDFEPAPPEPAARDEADLLDLSELSEFGEISAFATGSEAVEASELADGSAISEISEFPELSEISDLPEVSQLSGASEADLSGPAEPIELEMEPELEPTPDDSLDRDDAFAASFAFGFAEPPTTAPAADELAASGAEVPEVEEVLEIGELEALDLEPSDSAAAVREPAGVTASARASTIGGYLAGLAAWRPGAGMTGLGSGFEATPDLPVGPGVESAAAPSEATDLGPAEATSATEPGWGAFEPDEIDTTARAPDTAPAEGPPESDFESLGWTEPEPAEPGHVEQEAPSEPEAAEPEPVIELADYFSDTAAAEPAPEEPEPAPAPEEDDDDDLQSFQAWLRSLKR